jgi:hypothetical protein
MTMENETNEERNTMIRAAIKACFAAHEPANVDCIKAKLPSDFWIDETGAEIDDVDKFKEVQRTFAATVAAERTKPETVESFPDYLPPSDRVAAPIEPVIETVAPVQQRVPSHAVKDQPSAQARLDSLRTREGNLLTERPALIRAQRDANGALEAAKQAKLAADPNRMTPAELSADYRRSSQAERAARVARQGTGQPRIAFVDAARKFSTGGDGSDFARRNNRTGDRRGGFSRAEAAARGFVNRDASRGGTPAPVVAPRVTIPALGKPQ